MAKKIMKVGKWYIAYEVTSTAAFLALAAYGIRLPGF
jgi:hypothetical protein